MKSRTDIKAEELFDTYFEKWVDSYGFKKSVQITLYPDTLNEKQIEIPVNFDYLKKEMCEDWIDEFYDTIESNEHISLDESNDYFNKIYVVAINNYSESEAAIETAKEYMQSNREEAEERYL